MNKIIIVGHPASGLSRVESQLQQCGLKCPLPSRREGLLPVEITDSLSKAHDVLPILRMSNESAIQPIQPAKIWELVWLDLMLGNVGQNPWGWADPQSLYFLDYWHELDPEALFLLVYDAAENVLTEAAHHGAEEPTEARVRQQLNSWSAYNGAMLRFFLHHTERCLLVNAFEAAQSPDDLLVQINAKLTGSVLTNWTKEPQSADKQQFPLVNPWFQARGRVASTAAEDYLVSQFLAQTPAHLGLFREMQSMAHLPLRAQPKANPKISVANAWATYVAQHRAMRDENHLLLQEQQLLLLQLFEAQQQLEVFHFRDIATKRTHISSKFHASSEEPTGPFGAAERVRQQLSYRIGSTIIHRSRSLGGLISLPLALIGQVNAYNREKAERGAKKLPPMQTYADVGEAEKVKKQLSYRLGNVVVKHSKSPIGWIKMPFAIRSEIAAFHQDRRANKSNTPS